MELLSPAKTPTRTPSGGSAKLARGRTPGREHAVPAGQRKLVSRERSSLQDAEGDAELEFLAEMCKKNESVVDIDSSDLDTLLGDGMI